MNTLPLEADTRLLIDTALTNLGWKLDGKDKNVFVEQPKTEAERKLLGGKRPDYVLYSKESDRPLIVIEAKKREFVSMQQWSRGLVMLVLLMHL